MTPRSPVITLAIAGACFVAGWVARGDRSPRAEYGRLSPVDAPCAVRGRPVRAVSDVAAGARLFDEPAEGRSAAVFRRRGGTAELWMARGPIDDEVHVAATTYQLEWREPAGWVVKDCVHQVGRRS
ncbi:MAG TPA: hypothetical protein VGB15_07990 [Longimicrobium sp.]|jgi:hypothetical protein